MRIKEVSDITGIKENVLRFYEEKELLKPARDENAYRNYEQEDVQRCVMISMYRKMGFSIAYIREMFHRENGNSKMEIFFQQQAYLQQQIEEMKLAHDGITRCLNHVFMNHEESTLLLQELQKTNEEIEQYHHWSDAWDFDGWAKNYDEVVHQKDEQGLGFYLNYEKNLDACASLCNEHIGKVLEIGIGTGNLAQRIISKQELQGIDQSIQMLMQTKQKYPDIPVQVGTFLHIPFTDNSFTTIVSSYAFHHNNEQEKYAAILEMDRVLCAQGRIILCDLMFENEEKQEAYRKRSTVQVQEELADEYFAHIDQLYTLFDGLSYRCQMKQLDELIWLFCAQKQ